MGRQRRLDLELVPKKMKLQGSFWTTFIFFIGISMASTSPGKSCTLKKSTDPSGHDRLKEPECHKRCSHTYEDHCSTIYEPKCHISYHTECHHESNRDKRSLGQLINNVFENNKPQPKKHCKKVPKKSCQIKPVKKCSSVPKQHCENICQDIYSCKVCDGY